LKTRAVIAWIAGILLVASSLAHAFLGWPPLRNALQQANADADLLETVKVGWLFGSVAMFAFGLIVLSRAVQLSRGRQGDRAPALVIGICYVTFGLIAFIGTGRNPHFLGFILIGALVTATALTGRNR